MTGDVDRSRRKEEGDLAVGVHGDVQGAAFDGHRERHCCTENDVVQLADGRIGEACFQFRAGQGDDGCQQDGARCKPGDDFCTPTAPHHFGPYQFGRDLQHGEDSGLDDGDRVQQGTDRGRCNHGIGQPLVQREDGGFTGAEEEEQNQHRRLTRSGRAVEDSAIFEIEGSGPHPRQHRGGEHEEGRRTDEDSQVDATGTLRLRLAGVGHQRPGAEGHHLVEEEKSQHVGTEGDAHRRKDGHGEGAPVALLPLEIFSVQPVHVAVGVDGVEDPQRCGDEGIDHPQRSQRQGKGEPRSQFTDGEGHLFAGQSLRQDRQHDRQQSRRDHQVEEIAQRSHRLQQPGEQCTKGGNQDGQKQGRDHGVTPINCCAASRARSTMTPGWIPRTMLAPRRISTGRNFSKGRPLRRGMSPAGRR